MQEDRLNEILTRFRGTRRYIWQLLAVAVLLALAINLVASVIYAHIGTYPSLALGLALGAVCLGYVAFSRLQENTYSTTIRGFFMVRKDSRELVRVPGYALASRFETTATAAFNENSALERQWQAEIEQRLRPKPTKGRMKISDLRIATEIAEYILLDSLGIHLRDYFNTPPLKESQLDILQRDDIPDVLLSNRILELISRTLQDRPWFDPKRDSSAGGKIVAVYGPDGQYTHFDLTMPKGSTVQRTAPGSLVINSKMVTLQLSAHIGLNYGTPRLFDEYYLNESDRTALSDIEVIYRIHARIRRGLGLKVSSWRYYSWVESFIESARKRLDGQEFFKRISWDSTGALLSVIFENYPPSSSQISAPSSALNENGSSEITAKEDG